MRNTLAALAAVLLGSTAVIAPAAAAPVVYTISGTYTGTISGNPFTSFATFTGLGDTASATTGPYGSTIVALSSLSALSGGTTYTLLGTSAFVASPTFFAAGFVNSTGNGKVNVVRAAALGTYNGLSSLGPLAVSAIQTPYSFSTNLGDVTITGASGLTFSAAVSAVPEPATWALMIAGFGMVGAGMRRRTKQATTTVTYA